MHNNQNKDIVCGVKDCEVCNLKPEVKPEVKEWFDKGLTNTISLMTSECPWENCSGGEYCEKHSFLNLSH